MAHHAFNFHAIYKAYRAFSRIYFSKQPHFSNCRHSYLDCRAITIPNKGHIRMNCRVNSRHTHLERPCATAFRSHSPCPCKSCQHWNGSEYLRRSFYQVEKHIFHSERMRDPAQKPCIDLSSPETYPEKRIFPVFRTEISE